MILICCDTSIYFILWVQLLFVGFRSWEKLLILMFILYYIAVLCCCYFTCVLDRCMCICILVTVLCLYDSYIIIKNASSWVSNVINHPPENKARLD